MLEKIRSYIFHHQLIPQNSTIIIGLSGGPDSVFLLNYLHHLRDEKNLTLIAAHLDHEWRADSAQDVAFCKQLCDQLHITFVSAKASSLLSSDTQDLIRKNGSQEELGRKLRRLFFEQVASKHGAQLIALAHHLQDQEETFFIRLIRGASLSGLTAMKPKHGLYIRPLLETNKADILAYLDTHHIQYLIDPTNASPSYLRNRIRHSVLPALHEVDERFDANFLRSLNNLQNAELFLEQCTQQCLDKCSVIADGQHVIDINQFFMHDDYIQRRMLMRWMILAQVPFVPTEKFLDEIIRFLRQEESKVHAIHHAWTLDKKKNLVRICKNGNPKKL